MMSKRVLITGGAGFIGSHLADDLLKNGYQVRALDCLCPQVHGPERRRPDYLNEDVDLVTADVRNRAAVRKSLRGIDAVVHLAARVGVGQSMYALAEYTDANTQGTAVLLEELMRHPVERLVVASSMSLYGEGLYQTPDGRRLPGSERTLQQLKSKRWELRTSTGEPLVPVPTPECKEPSLASSYALSKFDQERMCLMIGRAYNIPAVALRFFNVYGTRQALSNPYTGVLAIFASRLLNDHPPLVFEDGSQQRDFVSVYDVAQAARLALENPSAAGEVFNVGSGEHFMVREIAERMALALNKEFIHPEITENYRVGDIRHCFADISRAQEILRYQPRVTLEDGLRELAAWLEGQAAVDNVAKAREELAVRGLTV